jgi:predicted nucleic acid-binding protein
MLNENAGLPAHYSPHSFRATGITNFLENDGTLEAAQHHSCKVATLHSDLFRRGTDFFSARPDKEWSLTDSISFVVMSELGITDTLTSDHHFEQAGFRVLLKD